MTLRPVMVRVCAVVIIAAVCSKGAAPKLDSASAAPARPGTDSGAVVTTDGLDVIHVRASLEQLSAAVGSKVPPARTPAERGCRYVFLGVLPGG